MGEFRSPLDSTQFDLYVLGRPPRFKHLEPVATGFSGLAVPLSEARALVERRRQDGIAVAVVPVHYRDQAHLPAEQATPIALEAFARYKADCNHSFGPLVPRADKIGWWEFCANDLTAQEQGMIPGVMRIYVDKVLARALDDEEYEWVSSLTYGG
jgi:hypothetical protein